MKFDFIAEDADFCLSENLHTIDSIKNYLDEYFNKENRIPFIINNQNSIELFINSSAYLVNLFKIILETKEFEKPIRYRTLNLFIWALFQNRIEIALIFWQLGHVSY